MIWSPNTTAIPRALIVDDDPVLQLTIQQCIDRLGYETMTARDGQEALRTFRRQPADIVLLDAAIPVMDGFMTCQGIRDLPDGAHIPIIMITVYDDEQSVDRAFQAGANEYITKPIHWAVLRNRIKQLAESVKTERSLRNDRAFFQSLVDSIPEPTLVCDQACVVRWINVAAKTDHQIYELEVGKPFTLKPGIGNPDDTESTPDKLTEQIRTQVAGEGNVLERLLYRQNPDDTQMFVELQARPMYDANGSAQGVILRFHDITAREIEERQLRHQVRHYGQLAFYDSLTGLTNRRLFEQHLHEAIVDGALSQQRHALLFIDLDGFKAINDNLGHQAGDEILKLLATRLVHSVRRTDTVCRLGGDEFAILLRNIAEPDSSAIIAQHLLKHIAKPIPSDLSIPPLSASIGVSLYPDHAETASNLIYADEAMYEVKSMGKSGVRVWGLEA